MIKQAADNLPASSPEYAAFSQWVTLTTRKKALADETADVEAALKALEPQLLAYLGEGGYDKVRVAGYTIFPFRETWVYPRDGISRSEVCQALKQHGLGHYVSEQYNTRSISKYVADLERDHDRLADQDGGLLDILPPEQSELSRVIEVRTSYRVHSRRS